MDKKFNLYNSLSGVIESIYPRKNNIFSFYACGPTVYSYPHIGNFRSFLTADLVVRTAKSLGWNVNYICNITDVGHLTEDDVADSQGEDKMQKAMRNSKERFRNIWDLARYYTNVMLNDWNLLNLIEPNVRPRATEHIAEQIDLIEQLDSKGCIYETKLGVYFDITKFERYGELSGNNLGSLIENSRNTVFDIEKKNQQDFALWKKDKNHSMRWYSKYGWGYPGWHLECSAMALKYLGDSFDLHSGGVDNKFPHHECEIAQSESARSSRYCHAWLHTSHLLVDGKRMAKSDGNFITVSELLNDNVNPLALRHALTCAKYGDSLNFTKDSLASSIKFISKAHSTCLKLFELKAELIADDIKNNLFLIENYSEIQNAMLDNLNTPIAYTKVHAGIKYIVKNMDIFPLDDLNDCLTWFKKCDDLLGIINIESLYQTRAKTKSVECLEFIEKLVGYRDEARANGNFLFSDKIRDDLEELGVMVQDIKI